MVMQMIDEHIHSKLRVYFKDSILNPIFKSNMERRIPPANWRDLLGQGFSWIMPAGPKVNKANFLFPGLKKYIIP